MSDIHSMCKRLYDLIGRVNYRRGDYEFIVGTTEGMKYPYLQVAAVKPCTYTGEPTMQKGGKHYISEYACDSEIFQCMLSLALAFEAHEVREDFMVDGKRVFGPHISTAALAVVADQLDHRS